MKKTFIQNLVLLVGLNLLVKPFYLLFVETEIQNRTGPEAFGVYFALINFSFLLNIIPDLGITNWNTRKTAQEGFTGKARFAKLIKLRMVLAAIYLVVALSVGMILQYSNFQLWLLFVLALNQVVVSGILYFRSFLTGMHLFKSDSIVSVLDRLLLLGLMSFCLWGLPSENVFQIEWLIYGQTLCYAITLLAAIVLLLKGSAKNESTPGKDFSTMLVLKESFPFALLIMLSMIGYRADSVMLERMKGADEAGIYAMGFRFFEAVNMISYLFAVLLLPIFSKQLSEKKSIAPLLQQSFQVLYTGAFMVAIISCFYADQLLSMFYDNSINESSQVFSWLMVSSLFFSLQYVFGTLITASGKMKPLIWIALFGMLYNFLLNMIYIPTEGAVGAAKASCFSQLVIFIAQLMVVASKFEFGNLKPLAFRTAAFSMLSIGTAYLLNSTRIGSLVDSSGWILLLIIMIIYAFLIRMLDIRTLGEILPSAFSRRTSLTLHNQDKTEV